jgi:hypothetical protein
MWVVYRGNQPEDRYYSSGGLYEAPDQMTYRQKIYDDGVAVEAAAAPKKIETQFGKAGLDEAGNISRAMFRLAQSSGSLVPAGGSRG